MDQILDLFGNVVRDRKGMRGRPSYEATPDDRNKIKLLLALGKSISIMANALGVSPATVKRYFRAELKVRDAMRDRMEAAMAMKLWEGVMAGNVTAIREFQAFKDRNDRMEIERTLGSTPAEGDEAAPLARLGKKQVDRQRAIDADADLMSELEQEAAAQDVAVH